MENRGHVEKGSEQWDQAPQQFTQSGNEFENKSPCISFVAPALITWAAEKLNCLRVDPSFVVASKSAWCETSPGSLALVRLRGTKSPIR